MKPSDLETAIGMAQHPEAFGGRGSIVVDEQVLSKRAKYVACDVAKFVFGDEMGDQGISVSLSEWIAVLTKATALFNFHESTEPILGRMKIFEKMHSMAVQVKASTSQR